MKRILVLAVFIFFTSQSFAGIKGDSVAITGWLVFINDDVIFMPSEISSDIKPKDFFTKSEYPDGLLVSSFIKAPQYRRVAKTFRVRSGTKNIKRKIKVIPVKTIKVTFETDPTEKLAYLIYFRGKEVSLTYQFWASYYTLDLLPLNEKHKRKLID